MAGVDLRPAIDQMGLAVRDQGFRPTCSVFATTFLLEHGVGRELAQADLDFSEEYLNAVTNAVAGTKGDGDFLNNVALGYEAGGIVDEAQFPYRAAFAPALQPSPSCSSRARSAAGTSASSYDRTTANSASPLPSSGRSLPRWTTRTTLRWGCGSSIRPAGTSRRSPSVWGGPPPSRCGTALVRRSWPLGPAGLGATPWSPSATKFWTPRRRLELTTPVGPPKPKRFDHPEPWQGVSRWSGDTPSRPRAQAILRLDAPERSPDLVALSMDGHRRLPARVIAGRHRRPRKPAAHFGSCLLRPFA